MIVVVGLSHRSAPIEVRERIAIAKDALPGLLREMAAAGVVGEVFVISTCNRVEVFAAARRGADTPLPAVSAAACRALEGRAPGVAAHLYVHEGPAAVQHLFRVSASLDSMVLGEPQILGQVKDAFEVAREVGTLGPILNRVVPRALRSAKRVRTETSVGSGQVSVPSVAVDLARQIFGDLSRHTVALIGSGEMGETVARLLRQAGSPLIVVGRNAARVQQLAGEMGGSARRMEELVETLVDADVVVTTTSARGTIVELEQVKAVRRARRGRSLFFIDLAVPRDVDPRIEELDGIFLYNVDDLSKAVAESLHTRQREAEKAEAIVADELAEFGRWADGERVTPLIVALRERFRAVLDAELERSLKGKLRHLGDAERGALERMRDAVVNKLMHAPSTRLRRLAAEAGAEAELAQHLATIEELFELVAGERPSAQVERVEPRAPELASPPQRAEERRSDETARGALASASGGDDETRQGI